MLAGCSCTKHKVLYAMPLCLYISWRVFSARLDSWGAKRIRGSLLNKYTHAMSYLRHLQGPALLPPRVPDPRALPLLPWLPRPAAARRLKADRLPHTQLPPDHLPETVRLLRPAGGRAAALGTPGEKIIFHLKERCFLDCPLIFNRTLII